ncbi:unnamed protein product [Cochlearia groenlandica]
MACVLIPTFLLLLLCFSISPSMQNVTESEPLVRFKSSMNITKGDLNSWRQGTDPCNGKWFGIYCHTGQVTGIHITQLGLSGTINVDDLNALTNLKTVRLDNNNLSGPLPHFYKLRGLKSLMLSNNSFSGSIPDDFFNDMTKLRRLFLDHNRFFGKIPSSVVKLPNLEELHLQGNNFSGEIPLVTDTNKNLKIVDLSNNNLQGNVPDSLFDRKDFFLKIDGNHYLCGKALDIECEAVFVGTPMESENYNNITVYAFVVSITVLIVFITVVVIIKMRNKKRKFRMLNKEHPSENDSVEVRVTDYTAEKFSKDSTNYNGDNGGGGGIIESGMGDIVMVNSDKGSFGFPDLMKASAELLGNGSLGSAYKADLTNGLSVVVKRIKDMNKLSSQHFNFEMRRLGKLRHPNILTPLAYNYRREEKLVVSEYMPQNSLFYVLHGDHGTYHSDLTWPTRLKIIRGVARGMLFLHEEFASHELPHGNLKSSNILLSQTYEPKLNDYAFLPFLEEDNASQALFAFKTPEFAKTGQVTQKSDVYCLGIVILEILTGKLPSQYLNKGKSGIDIVQWIQSLIKEEQVIDSKIRHDVDSMRQMLELLRIGVACIASNPDERLDIRETVRRIEQVRTL